MVAAKSGEVTVALLAKRHLLPRTIVPCLLPEGNLKLMDVLLQKKEIQSKMPNISPVYLLIAFPFSRS